MHYGNSELKLRTGMLIFFDVLMFMLCILILTRFFLLPFRFYVDCVSRIKLEQLYTAFPVMN